MKSLAVKIALNHFKRTHCEPERQNWNLFTIFCVRLCCEIEDKIPERVSSRIDKEIVKVWATQKTLTICFGWKRHFVFSKKKYQPRRSFQSHWVPTKSWESFKLISFQIWVNISKHSACRCSRSATYKTFCFSDLKKNIFKWEISTPELMIIYNLVPFMF